MVKQSLSIKNEHSAMTGHLVSSVALLVCPVFRLIATFPFLQNEKHTDPKVKIGNGKKSAILIWGEG